MAKLVDLIGLCVCLCILFVISIAQDENRLCVNINIDVASGLFTNTTSIPTSPTFSSAASSYGVPISDSKQCMVRPTSKVPEVVTKTPAARNTIILTFLAIQQALSHRKCAPFTPSLNQNAEHLQATLCNMPARRPHSATEWARLEAMARRHAPILRLAEDEEYFPLDPHQFALNSDLVIGDNVFYPHLAHGNTSAIPYLLSQLSSALPSSLASLASEGGASAPAVTDSITTPNSTLPTATATSPLPSLYDDTTKPYLRLRDQALLRGRNPENNRINVPVFSDILVRDKVAIATVQYYIFFPFNADNHMDLHVNVGNSQNTADSGNPQSEKSRKPGISASISLSSLFPLSPIGEHEGDWQTVDVHIDMLTDQILGISTWGFGNNEELRGEDGLLLSWLHQQPLAGKFYPRDVLTFVDTAPTTPVATGTASTSMSTATSSSAVSSSPAGASAPTIGTTIPKSSELSKNPGNPLSPENFSSAGSRLQLYIARHTHTIYPSLGSHALFRTQLQCGGVHGFEAEYNALFSHLSVRFAEEDEDTSLLSAASSSSSLIESSSGAASSLISTSSSTSSSSSPSDVTFALTAALTDHTSEGALWDTKKSVFWRSPSYITSSYYAATKVMLDSVQNEKMPKTPEKSFSENNVTSSTLYRDWFESIFGEVSHGLSHWTSNINNGSTTVANSEKLLQVYRQFYENERQNSDNGKNMVEWMHLHPTWQLLNINTAFLKTLPSNNTNTTTSHGKDTSTSIATSAAMVPITIPSLAAEVPWAPWWAILPIKWGEDAPDRETRKFQKNHNSGKNTRLTKTRWNPSVCSKRSLKQKTQTLTRRLSSVFPFLKHNHIYAVSALYLAWICGDKNPYQQLDEFTDPGMGVYGPLSLLQYTKEYAANGVDAPDNEMADYILRILLSSAEITSSVQDLYLTIPHANQKKTCANISVPSRIGKNEGVETSENTHNNFVYTVANFRDKALQVDANDVLSLSPLQTSQSLQNIKSSIQKSIKESEHRLHQVKAKMAAARKELGATDTAHRDLLLSLSALQTAHTTLSTEKQSLIVAKEKKRQEEKEARQIAVSAVTSAITDKDREEVVRLRTLADSLATEIITIQKSIDNVNLEIASKKKLIKETKVQVSEREKVKMHLQHRLLLLQREEQIANRMIQMGMTSLARITTILHTALAVEKKIDSSKKILYSELQREQRHIMEVRLGSEKEWIESKRKELHEMSKNVSEEQMSKTKEELEQAKVQLIARLTEYTTAQKALTVAKVKAAEVDVAYEKSHGSKDDNNADGSGTSAEKPSSSEQLQQAVVSAQMAVGEASISLEHAEMAVTAAKTKVEEIEGILMDYTGKHIEERLQWYTEKQKKVWEVEYKKEDEEADRNLLGKLDIIRNNVYSEANKDLERFTPLLHNMEEAQMNVFLLEVSLIDSDVELTAMIKKINKIQEEWEEEAREHASLSLAVEQAKKKYEENAALHNKTEVLLTNMKEKQKQLRHERTLLAEESNKIAIGDLSLSFYTDYKQKREKLLEKQKTNASTETSVMNPVERKKKIAEITEELKSMKKILTKTSQELRIMQEEEKTSRKYYTNIQKKLANTSIHRQKLQQELQILTNQKKVLVKKISDDREVLTKLKNKILILSSRRDAIVANSATGMGTGLEIGTGTSVGV